MDTSINVRRTRGRLVVSRLQAAPWLHGTGGSVREEQQGAVGDSLELSTYRQCGWGYYFRWRT